MPGKVWTSFESLLLIKEEPRKVILKIKCTYEPLGDLVEIRILIKSVCSETQAVSSSNAPRGSGCDR